MTPLMLQDDLVEEIKRLTAGSLFPSPKGERVQINVFPQNIPIEESEEDEDEIITVEEWTRMRARELHEV